MTPDAGSRKFGVALAFGIAAATADQWEVVCLIFVGYTLANVVLKLSGRDPEAAE